MRILQWLVALMAFFATVVAAQEYSRRNWARWSAGDARGDRLDTRQELLRDRSVIDATIECGLRRCKVTAGRWIDAYTGRELVARTAGTVAALVTVEHVVPLVVAHRSGAQCWSRKRQREFFNDKRFLLLVSRTQNSSRGGQAIHDPPHRPCRFARLYVEGKEAYGLGFAFVEARHYGSRLESCANNRRP